MMFAVVALYLCTNNFNAANHYLDLYVDLGRLFSTLLKKI